MASKIVALLSSKSRVDAPFIRVRIGDYVFGVYNKSKGKITFPFDNEAELEKLICIFDKLKESE